MKTLRDLDAELEALQRRAKALKGKRVSQLGELVIATGADQLGSEVLAGALSAASAADAATQEVWRRAGTQFFQGQKRPSSAAGRRRSGASPSDSGAAST